MKRVILRHYLIGLIMSVIIMNVLILIPCVIENDYSVYNTLEWYNYIVLGLAMFLVYVLQDYIMYLLKRENSQVYKLLRELEELK